MSGRGAPLEADEELVHELQVLDEGDSTGRLLLAARLLVLGPGHGGDLGAQVVLLQVRDLVHELGHAEVVQEGVQRDRGGHGLGSSGLVGQLHLQAPT